MLVRQVYDLIWSMAQNCAAADDLLQFVLDAILALRDCRPETQQAIAQRFKDVLLRTIGPLVAILAAVLVGSLVQNIRNRICQFRNELKRRFQALIRRILAWMGIRLDGGGGGVSPCGSTTGGGTAGPGGGGPGGPPVNPCGNCFPAETLAQTADGHYAIETLRVGQRVTTLHGDEWELFLAEPAALIDPATWWVFTVRQDQGDAGVIEADLLRPQGWFGVEVQPGERWELDLRDLGLAGEVEIIDVNDCPAIEPGPGRLVLSVFRHTRGNVGSVRLVGQKETLRITAGHPVWSNTENGWVAAGELLPGEELRTWQGTVVVEVPWELDGEEPVYNIEVDGDHVFRVGIHSVLVHNDSAAPAFRLGGRTAKNLTPRPGIDDTTGLSLTTTPGRGWTFTGGKDQLRSLGFEVEDDGSITDPGHFLLRPGTGFVSQGWTLVAWAATRPNVIEDDRCTWHELTKILYDAGT